MILRLTAKQISQLSIALVLLVGCASETGNEADLAPPLTKSSTDQEIAKHLDWHEEKRQTTTAMAELFPAMERARGYEIQKIRLMARKAHDPIAGWKLGFSRKAEADYVLDTVFAPVHSSLVYSNTAPLDAALFVEGRPALEPEVVISLKSDLIKNGDSAFTREQVAAAVDWVGTGIEFGASRLRAFDDDHPVIRTHLVTDNISHAGVILPNNRVKLQDVNWEDAVGTLVINDEVKAQGHAQYIMGVDPLQGVVWLANEMDKFGYQLKAGQFILTGSVDTPAPAVAGDTASVTFNGLGATTVEFQSK